MHLIHAKRTKSRLFSVGLPTQLQTALAHATPQVRETSLSTGQKRPEERAAKH